MFISISLSCPDHSPNLLVLLFVPDPDHISYIALFAVQPIVICTIRTEPKAADKIQFPVNSAAAGAGFVSVGGDGGAVHFVFLSCLQYTRIVYICQEEEST